MLYTFSQDSSKTDWIIVNDAVMGGRSDGEFFIDESGNGVFQGKISLEYNGGFSSVRHAINVQVGNCTKVKITLKGDGKSYQFRIKSSPFESHSYVSEFQTSGSWEVIEIALLEMYPTYRGRKLPVPNFKSNQIRELAFLIGNKKPESFKLEISKIELI